MGALYCFSCHCSGSPDAGFGSLRARGVRKAAAHAAAAVSDADSADPVSAAAAVHEGIGRVGP